MKYVFMKEHFHKPIIVRNGLWNITKKVVKKNLEQEKIEGAKKGKNSLKVMNSDDNLDDKFKEEKKKYCEKDNFFAKMAYNYFKAHFLTEKVIYNQIFNFVNEEEKKEIVPKKFINVKEEVYKIRKHDKLTNSLNYNIWSGLDVLEDLDSKDNIVVVTLNKRISRLQSLKNNIILSHW